MAGLNRAGFRRGRAIRVVRSGLPPVTDIADLVQDAEALLPFVPVVALLLQAELADVRTASGLVLGEGDGVAADGPGPIAAKAVGGGLDHVSRYPAGVADRASVGVPAPLGNHAHGPRYFRAYQPTTMSMVAKGEIGRAHV